MLADIEGKIDKERRLLSQVDLDLNNKGTDYMDYTVTDIWWDDSQLTEITTVTELSTTPTLFGETTETTVATHSPNWPFPKDYGAADTTQQESLIQHDLKNSMAVDGLGYGSASLVKFLELIMKKDFLTATDLFNTLIVGIDKRIDEGKLASVGQDVLAAARQSLVMIQSYGINSPTAIEAISSTQLILKNKNIPIDPKIREAIGIYDNMFTKEEGDKLFATLEVFERFPEVGKTSKDVCEPMLNAVLAPYKRMEGTWEQKKFVRLITQATYNELRMGSNLTDRPERRSMNYKKIVQHLLHKHPRILKKLNEHHKERIRRHRRDSRDYHNYDETRSKKYSSHRFRQRALSVSSNEPDRESMESAFYHEHHVNDVSSIRKKVMHQIKKRNRMKRRKHRRERRKHRRNRKRKQRHHHSTTSLSTTPTVANATTSSTTPTTKTTATAAAKKLVSGLSPEYLKQLAISYFRKKQETQNFRRFNIPSSDEEMYDMSGYSNNSTEHNNLLQKITEDTSYSDEEDHLRNNLYDALRHDNRTLVKFRAIHEEDDLNDTVRDMSKETDDEWLLKNNIYKVFEKKNQVYRK
ncbi:uncharacterized protein LOC111360329 [Spodoptera litura]|uniref:Uncharacterized protein LOC111360329 n=1 Tax=Spodoptera litura TaxID=69820 RepID=A0A9J7EPY6_SPOLT|nr:uncharacterized protein LOC111360329 [Spodoptera litura]